MLDLQSTTTPRASSGPARITWEALAGAVLALALAYGGQAVLLGTELNQEGEGLRQALAGAMLITAALIFGATVPPRDDGAARLAFPDGQPSRSGLRWGGWWALGWLAAAIVLASAAIALFSLEGESPPVIAAWLGGALALLIAQLRGVPRAWPRVAPAERGYLLGLAALLAVALVTRVYRLTTLPPYVDGDFAAVGLQARALVTGEQKEIFTFGWADVPMLGYLPPWLTMQLFGTGLAGLSASGVIEGLLVIAGVYLLGRDMFNARAGLLAAALMTISYAHLASSRQSSYIDPVFFMLYAVYFLLIGLREGRGWALVLSGALTALCVQMYYSGRLVIVVVGFVMLFLPALRWRWARARWGGALLWGLALLITLGPMLVVFARDLGAFMSRTRAVYILAPENIVHQSGVFDVDTVPDLMLQQARRTALFFYYYGDTSTQFGIRQQFLDPITAPLFTLGLGSALFGWRRLSYALLVVWVVAGMVLGCFLTINPPFWPRLLVLLPPTTLLAAVALDRLCALGGQRLGGAALALALALLAWAGVMNWNTYMEFRGDFITARSAIVRYLEGQPPTTRGYMVSDDFDYSDREFDFMVPGRLVADLTAEEAEGEIERVGAPTLVILTYEQGELAERIWQRNPGSTVEVHTGSDEHSVEFYVVRLP